MAIIAIVKSSEMYIHPTIREHTNISCNIPMGNNVTRLIFQLMTEPAFPIGEEIGNESHGQVPATHDENWLGAVFPGTWRVPSQ